MVNETLRRKASQAIDTVILFTVNLPARQPSTMRDLRVWLEMHRSPGCRCSDAFLERLRTAWFTHLKHITGLPCETVDLDTRALAEMTNVIGRRGIVEPGGRQP
jgi:hypothetical protein